MILKLKMSLFNVNSKFFTIYENYEKCLLKRHFKYKPNFFKIVEGVKRHLSQFPKNGILLKVSLEEIPSIIFFKNGFILKVYLQETFSTIFIHSRKFRIYAEGVSSLPQFPRKWNYTWKPFIIFKNWVYTESVSSRDTFHNFYTQWKNSNFEKAHSTFPKK